MDKSHLSYAPLLFFNGFGILVLRCSVLENYAWNLRNASLIWQERFFLPITKMGIILTFSNQKGCCNVVRSVLLYFERKENQSFIFVSGGLFQLSYFTKLPDYYKCSFTGADMRLYSKKSCETDLPSLYSMKIWVNFFPNISLSNHMH